MSQDLSQAVSFANGYFALADGLVGDLDNYLAEDVILDWFGQTIKGRNNVSAFMKYQNINSRHIIDEINSSSTIEYRKSRPLRRKYYSIGSCGNKTLAVNNEENGIWYKRKCYSEGKMDSSSDETEEMDVEMEYSDFKKASTELQNNFSNSTVSVSDLNFDKLKLDSNSTVTSKPLEEVNNAKDNFNDDEDNDNDDDNLKLNESNSTEEFLTKLDARPTNFHEIEQKIYHLSETNKVGWIKKEHGQGDGPIDEEKKNINSVKYVEACGVIKSARFFCAKQIRKDLRQRQCRIQIAYSNRDINFNLTAKTESIQIKKTEVDNVELTSAMLFNDVNSNRNSNSNSKLLSLQEIRELGNKLVPRDENANYSDNDEDCYYNDRNKFLRCLELEITDKDVKVNENDFVTPNYKRQKLMFDNSPKRLFNGVETAHGFVFNYTIHLIIYESNTKCRLNLSHEFDY